MTSGARGTGVRAGVIAAGRGDRLRQATHTLKPLVRVAGQTLIERVLSSVAEAGTAETVIIVNEASVVVREYVAARQWPFALRWIVETTPSSMHSFLRVIETLAADGDEGPFLMSTVDTIAPPGAFASFWAASKGIEADVTLALNPPPADDEKPLLVRLGADGSRIEALGESVRLEPDPTYADVRGVRLQADRERVWATAGYYAVRASILREADEARNSGISALRGFFERLLTRGYDLRGVSAAGGVDVDRPADVGAAEAFLRQAGV